jgi:pilus assembly protein Flp/PilA
LANEPEAKLNPEQPSDYPRGEETFMDLIVKFIVDEAGAAAVEYAFILVILGVAMISAYTALGTALTGVFTNVSGNLSGGG